MKIDLTNEPPRREVKARFAFWQPGFGPMAAMDLYTLDEDIPGHCARSQVSSRTLERMGLAIPAIEVIRAMEAKP